MLEKELQSMCLIPLTGMNTKQAVHLNVKLKIKLRGITEQNIYSQDLCFNKMTRLFYTLKLEEDSSER